MTALTIEVPLLARRVRLLSWLSLAWMAVEGGVAIAAGIVASSIALVGFGLDSAIEGFASLVIVWRFTGERMFSARAERRAQQLVAIQFFLLAPYVAVESARSLAGGDRDAALDRHPREAQPRERADAAGEPAVGRLVDARLGHGRRRQHGQLEAHALTPSSSTASSSTRPRSVSR